MKSILITGGCGFIGSHTCLALLENNYKIVVIDSFKILSLIIQAFIPHLSEEIWKKFGGKKLAIEQDWPMVDKSLLIRNFNIAVQINGKTKEILSLTQELDKDSVVNMLKENNKISRLLKNKRIIK